MAIPLDAIDCLKRDGFQAGGNTLVTAILTFDAQRQEMNPARREALLKELSKIAQEDPPLLLLQSNTVMTVWSKNAARPAIGGDKVPFFDLAEKR